jgi:TldD protein
MSDFHDVRILKGNRIKILLDNGKLEEITQAPFQGVAIRALFGEAWGLVTSDDIESFDDKIELARRIAHKINRPKELKLGTSIKGRSIKFPLKKDPRDISLDEKVAIIREIEDAAKMKDVSSTQAIYSEIQASTNYYNSEGLDLESEITRMGFVISAVAQRNCLIQWNGESRAGVGGLEIFDRENPIELAELVGKTAVALLDAKVAKGGSFPVIMDQELAGVFIHEAVGHATEADIVLEGGSCLEGKLGEKIGSDLLTVKDDPSLWLNGYYPFDDEGSLSQETVLLKEGVLNSYLHTRETAGRLGGSARNARSEGTDQPLARMSNTYVDNGECKFEELLEELGRGFYLVGSRGGQVDTAEGVFQFNAKRGYIIENGEKTGLLRDVSLSGRTLETLNDITAIGNDLKFNSGRCGKGGQLVPISDGSPHLLIAKAIVGGAA